MKYGLEGLYLNQPIFSTVKFQNGIRSKDSYLLTVCSTQKK